VAHNEQNVIAELNAQKLMMAVWIVAAFTAGFSLFIAYAAYTTVTRFGYDPGAWYMAGLEVAVWLGVCALTWLSVRPDYRPDPISALVKSDGLALRRRKGSEDWIPYTDVKRIAVSPRAAGVILKSGKRSPLGFGTGGTGGEILLKAYKDWAAGKGFEVLEYDTRDNLSSHPVKNVEFWERAG
jgi:hypothetical protein